MKSTWLAGFITILAFSAAEAQTESDSGYIGRYVQVYADAGLGWGYGQQVKYGISTSGSISIAPWRKLIICAQEVYYQKGFLDFFDLSPAEAHEVALMAGFTHKRRYGILTLTAGPSYITGYHTIQAGEFDFLGPGVSRDPVLQYYNTWGLAAQANAAVTVLPFLGIGLKGTANLNAKNTTTGLFFSIYIGRFRKMRSVDGKFDFVDPNNI